MSMCGGGAAPMSVHLLVFVSSADISVLHFGLLMVCRYVTLLCIHVRRQCLWCSWSRSLVQTHSGVVLISCADTQWCGLGVQVAGSRRPSGGERTSGGLPCTSVTCRRCNLHTHTGITVLPRGRRRRRKGARAGEIGNPHQLH